MEAMTMNEIDAMSRLLELGGTMLAEHCRCGAPMFRYQGRVGCPICDFKMVDDEKAEKIDADRGIAKLSLHDLISDKIAEIAADMREEKDLGRIRDQMDCIERGVRVLGLLDAE